MSNKLMLKNYIGQNEINKIVDIAIKGQQKDRESNNNLRLLKRVYTKHDKKGTWLYIEWQQKDRINLGNDDTCSDCGYSGVLIYESVGTPCKIHPIDNLYLEAL